MQRCHVALVHPESPCRRTGNRRTAERWRRFLREMGHDVRMQHAWDGRECDLLLALHCGKSRASIQAFARAFPRRPRVVALTGTDLYQDLARDAGARACLELATHLIVLQEQALAELPPHLRQRACVVHQSAVAPPRTRRVPARRRVAVIGHLREVKDPFRTAAALSHLPPELGVEVLQIGAALAPEFEQEAEALMRRHARYRWAGELAPWQARRAIGASWLTVNSSRLEGGANSIAESIAAGVPVLASHVPGNVGMLGTSYPGYFAAGDERALAGLIRRAAEQPLFYVQLAAHCAARAPLFEPARERGALARLMAGLRETPCQVGSEST